MDASEAARREAERIHQSAVENGIGPWNLLELVGREAAQRDLDVYALATGDSALKGGRARSDAFDGIEYTLLHLATTQAYGGSAQVEVTYLTSETTQAMEISERKHKTRSEKVQDFVTRVRAGDFPVKEEARTCPRCPNVFICGDLPAGAITIKKI
jgi:hypothetical protein